MRHYEGKTKEELLEIIEQLEEKIDFLSSHPSPPSQERFRDKIQHPDIGCPPRYAHRLRP